MRFRTKLALSFFGLSGTVVALAGLLYWGAGQAEYNLERSRLAHEELSTYLNLSAETYRVFKQVRRDLIDGRGAATFDLAVSKARFEQQLAELADEIDQELALAPRRGEQYEEHARLAALTEEIGGALEEVEVVQALIRDGKREEAIERLSTTLEDRVDRRITAIIDAGIADEREEVGEAEQASAALIMHLQFVAKTAAAFAVAFALFVVWFLIRHLRGPLVALNEGTSRIAAGHLDHRITVSGRDEFAALARRFNDMATELQSERRALLDAQNSLEQTVEERTVELRQANETLQEQDALRRQFFADIGHELRTPITIIRGEAEVALRAKAATQDTYREALKRIVDVSGQLTRFVNDLFLIARSLSGVADMRKDQIALCDLVDHVCTELRAVATRNNAEIVADTPAQRLYVDGDEGRLRQLILILVDNALRHGPAGVRIDVKLTQDDGTATLVVADNGSGIPEAELKRVFDRFYRGNRASDRAPSGSGLGLPIAKSIAEGHGGQIAIDSAIGEGTRVSVSLPCADIEPHGVGAMAKIA